MNGSTSTLAQSMMNLVNTRIGAPSFERRFSDSRDRPEALRRDGLPAGVQAFLWAYPAVFFESIRLALKRERSASTTTIEPSPTISSIPRASGLTPTTSPNSSWNGAHRYLLGEHVLGEPG
jgi:hypothetical protein